LKIDKINNDPAIVNFEIPELSTFDFESFFNNDASRSDYGNLIVYDGRVTIPHTAPNFSDICALLSTPIYEITKTLHEMDRIRYPLFSYSSFDDFFSKSVIQRSKIGILPTIDKPGFSQPWHLDNRFVMVSGSINIQDNTTQTRFAKQNFHWDNGGTDFQHCELIHAGQSKKFTGTAWINTEHTWHCVPKVVDERRTILFNVFL